MKKFNLVDLIDPRVDFVRIRDVKAPNRANKNDAGMDLFIPNGTDEFKDALKAANEGREISYGDSVDGQFTISIAPHERIRIPSGLKVNIYDKDTYLGIDNKSGIANNKGLLYTADIIDADYRGECNICVVNTSNYWQEVTTGQKLVQVIHRIKIETQLNEISEEDFDDLETTDRGAGGFGSSGLK